jgi:hypothetical protein
MSSEHELSLIAPEQPNVQAQPDALTAKSLKQRLLDGNRALTQVAHNQCLIEDLMAEVKNNHEKLAALNCEHIEAKVKLAKYETSAKWTHWINFVLGTLAALATVSVRVFSPTDTTEYFLGITRAGLYSTAIIGLFLCSFATAAVGLLNGIVSSRKK